MKRWIPGFAALMMAVGVGQAAGAVVALNDIDSGLTSPAGDYRWLDVADQLYAGSYRSSYDYTQATVSVDYSTAATTLHGTLTATNLKPNFGYQLKLVAGQGDTGFENVGFTGRWWQETWNGSAWTGGQNLNNKGDGSSPNPNDVVYLARRDISDSSSPTGLKYKYTSYLVFDYFITDELGNASFGFEADSSYHVLWKTSQHGQGANDGPLKSSTFDPNLSETAYDVDYGENTVSIFGEWERLPVGGVFLPVGGYQVDFLLTEESFHGSGDDAYDGGWAAAMGGEASFSVVPEPSSLVMACVLIALGVAACGWRRRRKGT